MTNNNDDNSDSRKRKERPYLPAGGVQNGPNKRLNLHQTPNTPVMGPVQPTNTPVIPPAQPESMFRSPQMDSPAVYVAQQTTQAPDVAMASTDVASKYPQSQYQSQRQSQSLPRSESLPQAQYPQQQPQHVPQPVEHRPDLDTKLTPGFPNIEHADGQQQMAHQQPAQPQSAGTSAQDGQKGYSTGMLRNQATEACSLVSGGIPIEINARGWPGTGYFITAIPNSQNTISMVSGSKAREIIMAQYAHHCIEHGGIRHCTMTSVPIMSSRLPDPHQPRQPSTSTENLISTKKSDRGQASGKPQAQAQTQVTAPAAAPAPAPAPAQHPAQAHPQGQQSPPCPNCNRKDHLVGDCVGPPNRIHGDLPACPICDKFAGRVEGMRDPSGHRFDDCHHVKDMLHRHQWDIDHRLAYQDLAGLTDDELLMFFRSLVVKRVRKVPIRTKLVCWIDVLREAVRRFHNTDIIISLGNMTPWTKTFSIQQHSLVSMQAKPWEFYDYEAGITLSLPAGPVEQVQRTWDNFVAKGLPEFPAQVFVNSDRN